MFSGKSKQKAVTNGPVTDFDHPAIKSALRGEWLTLALATFNTTYSTATTSRPFDDPKAHGVVHFQFGHSSLIRCELTLTSDAHDGRYDRTGHAYFELVDFDGDPYVILRASMPDPRQKIEKALQAAFSAAALSEYRFVHVAFRRKELDVEAVLAELKERRYGGDHPLTEISLRTRMVLSKAPTWSWLWSEDR